MWHWLSEWADSLISSSPVAHSAQIATFQTIFVAAIAAGVGIYGRTVLRSETERNRLRKPRAVFGKSHTYNQVTNQRTVQTKLLTPPAVDCSFWHWCQPFQEGGSSIPKQKLVSKYATQMQKQGAASFNNPDWVSEGGWTLTATQW